MKSYYFKDFVHVLTAHNLSIQEAEKISAFLKKISFLETIDLVADVALFFIEWAKDRLQICFERLIAHCHKLCDDWFQEARLHSTTPALFEKGKERFLWKLGFSIPIPH